MESTTVTDAPTTEPTPIAPARRLRISHLVVQPVLVWDDGEEMTPADPVAPIQVPLSQLAAMAAQIPGEVAGLEARLAEHTEP